MKAASACVANLAAGDSGMRSSRAPAKKINRKATSTNCSAPKSAAFIHKINAKKVPLKIPTPPRVGVGAKCALRAFGWSYKSRARAT